MRSAERGSGTTCNLDPKLVAKRRLGAFTTTFCGTGVAPESPHSTAPHGCMASYGGYLERCTGIDEMLRSREWEASAARSSSTPTASCEGRFARLHSGLGATSSLPLAIAFKFPAEAADEAVEDRVNVDARAP